MSYASSAIKRLSNEYRHLQKPENRVSDFFVAPLEENIFEWHFTLRGPAGDDNSLPYKDGIYHGALIFSRSYPLEPPDIMFFTRSGRFATHEKICSTISSYHKELWQPTYDVALTLTALRHFMAQEEEFGVGAFPKNMVATETKVAWAKETWSFACATCGRRTQEVWETEMKMYPETSAEKEALVPRLPPAAAAAAAALGAATTSPDGEGKAVEREKETEALRTALTLTETTLVTEQAAHKTPAPTAQPDATPDQQEEEKMKEENSGVDSTTPAPVQASRPAFMPPPAAATARPQSETNPRDVDEENSSSNSNKEEEEKENDARPDTAAGMADAAEAYFDMEAEMEAQLWRSAAAPYLTDDVYFDDENENGVPRRCYLTALPLLNEEEARQLRSTDTNTGLPDMRFEPVLRAAIRREARERAAAAAAAAGLPPPPSPLPNPPLRDVFPDLAELLERELANGRNGVNFTGAATAADGEGPAAAAPPPPPQLAENVVLRIHTYRVSVPLRCIDRAIIWSFSIVVLILLRRAVCAALPLLWRA